MGILEGRVNLNLGPAQRVVLGSLSCGVTLTANGVDCHSIESTGMLRVCPCSALRLLPSLKNGLRVA